MRSSPSCTALSPPPPDPSLALKLFVAMLRDTSLALPSRSSDKLACKLSWAAWPEDVVERDQLFFPWSGGGIDCLNRLVLVLIFFFCGP